MPESLASVYALMERVKQGVACGICPAEVGQPCRDLITGEPVYPRAHVWRTSFFLHAEKTGLSEAERVTMVHARRQAG